MNYIYVFGAISMKEAKIIAKNLDKIVKHVVIPDYFECTGFENIVRYRESKINLIIFKHSNKFLKSAHRCESVCSLKLKLRNWKEIVKNKINHHDASLTSHYNGPKQEQ